MIPCVSRIDRFEDLIAWQKARSLTKRVYLASMETPVVHDFILRNQIRSAALSIPSNIAEGFERGGRAEFQQFLSIAKASCAELRSQLYVAWDVGYLEGAIATSMLQDAIEVSRIVGGLLAAVERQRRGTRRTQSSVLSPTN